MTLRKFEDIWTHLKLLIPRGSRSWKDARELIDYSRQMNVRNAANLIVAHFRAEHSRWPLSRDEVGDVLWNTGSSFEHHDRIDLLEDFERDAGSTIARISAEIMERYGVEKPARPSPRPKPLPEEVRWRPRPRVARVNDPWSKVALSAGMRVKGKVRHLVDFGAFVELEPGVDALLHISDLSWGRSVRHPSEVLKKGQVIEAVVLKVEREARRISLGLKQLQPDPWEYAGQRYRMGSKVRGQVVRLTDFGAFVELEPGVDGLLHISQMSNRPIGRPDELVSVGDELTLLVIRVDANERRIGLSMKELVRGGQPFEVSKGLNQS